MKSNIHPTYHPKTKATCNCGQAFEFGSTKENIQVEICSNCHPYYTGKSNLIDTAGRVERFKERMSRTEALKTNAPKQEKKQKTQKSKTNQENLKELKKDLAGK